MIVHTDLLTNRALARTAAQSPPAPPTWRSAYRIAAWLPTGDFHRMFPGILVYQGPGERRYFIPAGSRVWNRTKKGWTSWIAKTGSYKRFLDGRWWNETIMCDSAVGRYYDIAAPVMFRSDGVAYVDLYLDVEKRAGRTQVVDRKEWRSFLDGHPLAPDIGPLVDFGTREALHFGPATWRAAMDRMEGECRRWMRDLVRDRITELGITPSRRPLPTDALEILLADLGDTLGTRIPRQPMARVASVEMGRTLFDVLTQRPAVRMRSEAPLDRHPPAGSRPGPGLPPV